TETDPECGHFAATTTSTKGGGSPRIAGTLTQRNCTDSGDLDLSRKSADVSRESCPASNATAEERRQVRSGRRQVATRNFYDNSNQVRNFSYSAARDRAQRKRNLLPR